MATRPGASAPPPDSGRRPLTPLARRTLVGALAGGCVFGGVALVQALRSGAPFPAVLQPIGVFAVLGLTVGALAGPLVGQALARRKERRG